MRLKYRRLSKIHLYMLYREEAERIGLLDEWLNVKGNFISLLHPIVAKYVDYSYYIPYGLNYINFWTMIDPSPIMVDENLQDGELIEHLLLRLPRILGKNRRPVQIDMVDRFTRNVGDGYRYAFNILERIGYVFKVPVIVVGDDNIARLYDKWKSMVVKVEDKVYWVV